MTVPRDFLEEVKTLLGEDRIVTDPWLLIGYERDYWPLAVAMEYAGKWDPEPPKAAVLPADEGEVVQILNLARRHGIPMVPYAGGTGVLGGALPLKNSVVLDVSPLDKYGWYNKESMIIYAEAGVPLIDLEEWLNSQGYTLRHFPQSFPTALIGGLIATKSIGQYSTGYGGIEDIVLGLHVATYNYGLVRIPPVPRRSVLWSLKHLYIGSEGHIGIITKAYLQARRLPECSLPFSLRYNSFKEALYGTMKLVQQGTPPELLRVYDELESQSMLGESGSLIIGVIEGPCNEVDARISTIENLLGRGLDDSEPALRWLQERFNVIPKIRDLAMIGLAFDTVEVALPWSMAYSAYKETIEKLREQEGIVYASAHASHFYLSGAAVYYTIVFELEKLAFVYNKAWQIIEETTSRHGGTISHHHGIGVHRLKWLRLEYDDNTLRLLKDLKKLLDPDRIYRDETIK